MSKVLIFGAGPRTKRTILPALTIVDPNFEVDFVTLSGKQYASEDINIECIKFGSKNIQYSEYDLIIISVPPPQVNKILNLIEDLDTHKIMIDTPVIREVFLSAKNTSIKVMQDIKYLPFLDILQQRGEIVAVLMRFSGYEYHGVALARHLIDTKYLSSKRYRNSQRDELLIYFDKNKKVEIKNPRDYKIGYIEICYSSGEVLVIGNKNTYTLFNKESTYINGENLLNKNQSFTLQIQQMHDKINTTNFIESIHSFKLLGLSTMFSKALFGNYDELPSITSCYEDYKITHTITILNRIKWKLRKILKNKQ